MDKVRAEALVRIDRVSSLCLCPLDRFRGPKRDLVVWLKVEDATLAVKEVFRLSAAFLTRPGAASALEAEPESEADTIGEAGTWLATTPLDHGTVGGVCIRGRVDFNTDSGCVV